MNLFFARTTRRIFVRTGFFALILGAAVGGAAQADPLSISPSGNVPAQSTLTVTWTPGSQPNAVLVIMQVTPNGAALTNTLVSTANTGTAHITLPAGLNCGAAYSYQVFKEEITQSAQILLTWGNLQGAYSPSFTVKCPGAHPLPQLYKEAPKIDAHKIPSEVDPYKATPKSSVKESCPHGDQVENGKCVVPRHQ